MDIVEMDFERILKTHYFIVRSSSSPSALEVRRKLIALKKIEVKKLSYESEKANDNNLTQIQSIFGSRVDDRRNIDN